MRPVYATATSVIAPLAAGVAPLWEAIAAGRSGVARHRDDTLGTPHFWGARFSNEQWDEIKASAPQEMLPFEQLAFAAAQSALRNLNKLPDPHSTVFILSSTKGAVAQITSLPHERLLLHHSAGLISGALGLEARPVVVSHACVSGVSALGYGRFLIQSRRYDSAIVVGADEFSRFVLSGFQSFQAVADGRCKPFDAARAGINLGEAGACIVLSAAPDQALARLAGASSSNDANHISGPSRTGEELALAIGRAMGEANIETAQIGMISAHGTATIYNDEMEAKAFARSGLLHAPVHSVKGSTGHTLGAAGVVESALLIESIRRQKVLPSTGFESIGVSEALNIPVAPYAAQIDFALKTASGFGGCNSVAVWAKV